MFTENSEFPAEDVVPQLPRSHSWLQSLDFLPFGSWYHIFFLKAIPGGGVKSLLSTRVASESMVSVWGFHHVAFWPLIQIVQLC